MDKVFNQHTKGEREEFNFLCRAVGCALGNRPQPFCDVIAKTLNQSILVQMALRHRCLPLLAAGLDRVRQAGGGAWVNFEPEVHAQMNRALAVGAGRSVFLARRLVSLLAIFNDSGVRALALKGPAMAHSLYGHVDYRPADDLDVWVHPRDFARASGIMEGLDFTPLVRLSSVEAQAHMKAGWDRGFRSPAGDYVVELCTGMAPRYFARLPDADLFWESSAEMAFEGHGIRTPAAEPLLELLCQHGMKHGWSRLLWVADIAALARPQGGVDWNVLNRQSREHGSVRMIDLGLRLARVHLGAEIRDGVVPAGLVQRASHFLSGQDRCAGFLKETLFHLAGRERWRDRIRYIFFVLFTPSFGDWRWISLPEKLFWLHWILHPLRLPGRAAKRIEDRKQFKANRA